MFRFLREQCNHKYCEYLVVDVWTEENAQDALLSSNYGGYIKKYNVELRYCKHCGETYKSYETKNIFE